jgi:hypothetical protein
MVWVVIVLAIPWHKSLDLLANAAILSSFSFWTRIRGWKLQARLRLELESELASSKQIEQRLCKRDAVTMPAHHVSWC